MRKSLLLLALFTLGSFPHARAQVGPVPTVKATILPATVTPAKVPPGSFAKFTYNWDAVPLDRDYTVFVHVEDASNKMIMQNDHQPPFPLRTSTWNGDVSYTMTLDIPPDVPDGTYAIKAGLYTQKGGRIPLETGIGVRDMGGTQYQIGTVTIDHTASPAPLDSDKPATLDLKGYKMTFHDEFKAPSISGWGPIGGRTRWIAHTPYNGDFGDATFVDPNDHSIPFGLSKNGLRIRASKGTGHWKSGIISSMDGHGNGFAQTYGYFEMRAKLPKGPGTWPAFWLLSAKNIQEKTTPGYEIDVIEQYGQWPQSMHSALGWWMPDVSQNHGVGNNASVANVAQGFHNYGFLWDKETMRFYFDGVEVWQRPSPPEMSTPMYVLVDLALGSGWPIDQTPDPSDMFVQYVRVYSKDPNAAVDPSVTEKVSLDTGEKPVPSLK